MMQVLPVTLMYNGQTLYPGQWAQATAEHYRGIYACLPSARDQHLVLHEQVRPSRTSADDRQKENRQEAKRKSEKSAEAP